MAVSASARKLVLARAESESARGQVLPMRGAVTIYRPAVTDIDAPPPDLSIGLSFDDSAVELDYRMASARRMLWPFRGALLLVLASTLLSTPWAHLGDGDSGGALLRLGLMVPVCGLSWALSFRPPFARRIVDVVTAALAAVILCYGLPMAATAPPQGLGSLPAGWLALLALAYAPVHLGVRRSALLGALTTLCFLSCVPHHGLVGADVAHALALVAVFNVMGIGTSYMLERRDRELFLGERELERADARIERLLLDMLPARIARRLLDRPADELLAEDHAEVTVLFADLVGFTEMAERLPAQEVLVRLTRIFGRFDQLVQQHRLDKIKTIGDAYMVAGGLGPERNAAEQVVALALEMQDQMCALSAELDERLELRIGVHTGPVVAGVLGRHRTTYDLWGDTVNTASRLESHGEPGTIQISDATRKLLSDRFQVHSRGPVELRGLGPVATWWVLGMGESSAA